jgi:hypothetical protein
MTNGIYAQLYKITHRPTGLIYYRILLERG